MSQQDAKSLGSMSSKSPFSLSRQGTLRSSHSRKNSTGHNLTLNTGRRSPSQQLISPSGGRRSPVFLMYDGNRTPLDLMFPGGNKSPTGHRSPLHFGSEFDRRSPTSTVHVQDQKSPTAVLLGFDEGRRSPTVQVQSRRSPINFPQGKQFKLIKNQFYQNQNLSHSQFYSHLLRIQHITRAANHRIKSIGKFGHHRKSV